MPRIYARRFTAEQQKAKRKLLNSAYHKKHPKRTRWHGLKKYGWTLELYMTVFHAQKECCAICGSPGHIEISYNRLRPDHNHVTNKPRGLLCNKCNVGLGMFAENPFILEAAAQYLREWNE